MLPMEYNYLTEFQAHTPDFDYLKSLEISEKINSISWLQGTGQCQMLLSANDKQAKLWKVRALYLKQRCVACIASPCALLRVQDVYQTVICLQVHLHSSKHPSGSYAGV